MSIVVIGAGPAGVRAVETLLVHKLKPVWIDEAPRAGGQIYRRQPENFSRGAGALYGFEAKKARHLHAAAERAANEADYRPSTLAWDVVGGAVQIAGPQGLESIACEALILATGAVDRVIPLPGWTMPGAFTLGAAQIALKAQAVAIGRRCVFFGTGPLLYLVAYQYAMAGAHVSAVLDCAPRSTKWRALPRLLEGRSILAKGLYYIARLKALGICVESGIEPLEILGSAHVSGLRYRSAKGAERRIACDAVAFGFGLRSETQLADLAGCRFDFDRVNRQWLPATDEDGRAMGVGGVYLAGDGARIVGADAAELSGERAALALVADRGAAVPMARRHTIAKGLARMERFRAGIEQVFPFPAQLARKVADETILCRCEAVTAGELRATLAGSGVDELNRAKAMSCVGMGRCQGRVCGAAAAEVLAAAANVDVAAVGRFRGQPPVKPLPIGSL